MIFTEIKGFKRRFSINKSNTILIERSERITHPTWKGSKVPSTEKSTTPFEDCNILRCLNVSLAFSWLNSTPWFDGNALSNVSVAGDPETIAAAAVDNNATVTIKATAIGIVCNYFRYYICMCMLMYTCMWRNARETRIKCEEEVEQDRD